MRAFVFAVLSTALAAVACAAPPADFSQHVEAARRQIGVPGMAIAIVEEDRVSFAKGFGVKALGKPERIDADTIFPTGSTGKAVTVAALGILVDERKIGWDDRVTDHLPGFQMYDPQRKVREALATLKARNEKPAGTGPSLPLARYTGAYKDPWYGNIDRVTMKAVSPIADFSYDYQDLLFTPVQDSR